MDNELVIRKLLGNDSFVKGKRYKKSFIKLISNKKIDNELTGYYFYIEDEKTYSYFNVEIYIKNNNVVKHFCDCPKYDMTHTCKHVAACIIHYEKEIFISTKDSYDLSKEILLSFINTESDSKIKRKLNLDIDLDFNEPKVKYKIKIGDKKLYSLSNSTKLNQFIDSYRNNTNLELTSNFIYEPTIHYFNDEDKKILDFLFQNDKKNSYSYYYERNDPFELNKRETLSLLLLLNNKSFTINNALEVRNIKYEFPSNINLKKNNNKYTLSIDDFDEYSYLDEDYKFIYYNHILYVIDEKYIKILKQLKENHIEELTFKEEDFNIFKEGLLDIIKDEINIDKSVNNILITDNKEANLYFDLYDNEIVCNLKFKYNNKEIDYFEETSNILRDNVYESNVLNDILSYKFNLYNNTIYISDFEDLCDFISYGIKELSERYTIYTDKKIDNTKIIKDSNITNNFSIGKDGILSFNFSIDNINVDEIDSILNSIHNKKKYYKLKDGNIINLEDNVSLITFDLLLKDLDITNTKLKNNNITLPKYKALYIDSLKKEKYKDINTDLTFDNFINNFNEYKNINISFEDNNPLREYQKDGVKWLYTIYKCDLGGILADEMGLGKSIQSIYFIKKLIEENPKTKVLIVSPTSLVYNWQKEFDKFAKDLKYVLVTENKDRRQNIINKFDDYNIFITSYGLIRNDNDEYEDKYFDVCIIDEAQAIKNYQTNLTKEIKKIKSHTKIALTGTPLENSVLELWSIFDFIMPGYLPSLVKFKEKYSLKDVDKDSLSKLKTLNKEISPFILRRKKKEVASYLPDKIENNIFLDLPESQKSVYLKVLEETKEEMNHLIKTEGYTSSKLQILQLLLRLREICIHPKMIIDDYKGESIKYNKLIDTIKNYQLENHKILIFSSFKKSLELLKEKLNKENITYYQIDGSVKGKDRVELVDKFNTDDTTCFLITLKSGGTGLNLTSADIVIHLDIWWNPQAENQATDRAHRIGQENTVTVIKLVTKGTIEEKILELQEKKKTLSDNLIEGHEEEIISSLSEEDIKKLLSYQDDK